jgi:hypothetical protein
MNNKKFFGLFALVTVLSLSQVFAQAGAPLDLASTGTTLATYVAGAAGAGIALLAAMYGVRIILRAFKSVK